VRVTSANLDAELKAAYSSIVSSYMDETILAELGKDTKTPTSVNSSSVDKRINAHVASLPTELHCLAVDTHTHEIAWGTQAVRCPGVRWDRWQAGLAWLTAGLGVGLLGAGTALLALDGPRSAPADHPTYKSIGIDNTAPIGKPMLGVGIFVAAASAVLFGMTLGHVPSGAASY
jgi:hypothetical protein